MAAGIDVRGDWQPGRPGPHHSGCTPCSSGAGRQVFLYTLAVLLP